MNFLGSRFRFSQLAREPTNLVAGFISIGWQLSWWLRGSEREHFVYPVYELFKI
jgi:hypothetical protein